MEYIKKFNQLKLESNMIGGEPSKTQIVLPKPIISRDTFATGKSDILVASQGYKQIIDTLKDLPKNTTIIVTGGASRVGEDKGFDNKALATKRAKNMILKLKETYPDLNYVEGQHTVGTSEESKKKDSDQAKKDQFVRIEFTKSGSAKSTSAIDNTYVEEPDAVSIGTFERNLRVIFPKGMNEQEVEQATNKIRDAIFAMGEGFKVGKSTIKITKPPKQG